MKESNNQNTPISNKQNPTSSEDNTNKIEEVEQKLPINFIGYTDSLIEQYFTENNKETQPEDFYKEMTTFIQNSQEALQNHLNKMLKDDELNTKKINEKKEIYLENLDFIKNLHNNFEGRIENLNQLYADKLAYISLLSKNLFEFEKYKRNMAFAKEIFNYITIFNSSDDISKIAIPDIFTDPDKILSEGIEVYLSFRQLLDSCSKYQNFFSNFKQLETRFKASIKLSISECYKSNDFVRLQTMMNVTEILNSDIIIDLYINYILDDIMKLGDYIESIKKTNFTTHSISEELFTLIFKIADEFHENILKYSSDQFGSEYSKIYLLFPENRQKLIIGTMVMALLKRLNEFRKIFISESDKCEETYVRLIEYIYPKSVSFLNEYKKVLEFSQSDLSSSLEQETSLFLRSVEAIYMNKERNLLNVFIQTSYYSKIKKLAEIKNAYNSKTMPIETLQSNFYDVISLTNFSVLQKKSKITISRYNVLIQNKEEKEDLIETFCKEVFDSIQELLIEYCLMGKFILQECEKKAFPLGERHYMYLDILFSSSSEFKRIYLYELRDFFRSVKFYENIEIYVSKCVSKIEVGIDNLFSELNSYSSIEFAKILKLIKHKDIYRIADNNPVQITPEFDRICAFIKPLLICMNENWAGMEKNKNMISLLFTNMMTEKMKDIMKNAKLTENGVVVMKNDFQKVANMFAECLEEYYYNKIYDVMFLSEIFTTTKDELNKFTQTLEKEGKYENDLIKLLIKKRKGLKID